MRTTIVACCLAVTLKYAMAWQLALWLLSVWGPFLTLLRKGIMGVITRGSYAQLVAR